MVQGAANWNTEQTQEWLQNYVDDWVSFYRKQTDEGEVASYIPILQEANRDHLGISIIGKDGMKVRSGDTEIPFTIQSISKVLSFIVACMEKGLAYMLDRVDVEPTGEAFNSIMHLEMRKVQKPFNPLINAGAITVTSTLEGNTSDEKLKPILDLMETILGYRPALNVEVYESERDSSMRNRAIGYYLLETGFLESDLNITLETYFKQCSIEVTVDDLAKIGVVLANDGEDPKTGEELIPRKITRLAKALMLTCGMYDASGKFAAYVGIPAKSGVSGGIVALAPPRVRDEDLPFINGCGIGVYGPALDDKGNSYAGIKLLRHIAKQWDLSIF
ncbi:glutaminase [Virgibacillus halodenitrificans]|uniref:glutaminase n=1 Tax=Virgibacillus halodenitrificans TaxID=1482 RepID=UPI00031B63F1|nr:glutaminase [Virgibacillus halodenitrificans]MCG1028050.1 glutaminase [Virgibacillus halodenitrificans]MCJ0933332.1 glutaminase [Virgibacillus halodenitrificans]MEC2159332.1 glutaminase [Virgibacillus halodenitrificans]MYL45772.1 glutaminase [Virgibacillus halodenitrificans]MYL58046.1 glutaminase [Virgibacillus halodenitrificans]